jgi:serine/threonine-protein kinase HipA
MIIINYLVQNGDAHLKNFGLIYSDLDTIKLAPAYDIVCTTVYIKNDIPALHLLGSKKWWSKKYLLKFGIESCDLTSKEAEKYYIECQNS